MDEELQLLEVDETGKLEHDLLGKDAETLGLPAHQLVLVLDG